MTNTDIKHLLHRYQSGEISRRSFTRAAAALGLGTSAIGALTAGASAQTPVASPIASPVGSPAASPVASTGGEVIRNTITREEYLAQLAAEYPIEEPQNAGGTIIYQESTDIGTVNPTLGTDTYSGLINGFVFEPLIGGSVINGQYVPSGLADGWEISPDGLEYTVFLHPGVLWHDGEPFTAEDVAFTFDGVLHENSLSVRKTTVASQVAGYEVIDDLTIKFYAHAPSAIFLGEGLGQFEIIARHIWDGIDPGDWASDPGSTGTDPARVVGTGPFTFQEWKLGEHVILARNENYWVPEEVPIIDTFTYQVVAEGTTIVAGLQTGAADLGGVGFGEANGLKESNPELQIKAYDSYAVNYYYGNQDPAKGTPFVDPRVRQALYYALDRQLLAETVYDGFAIQADGTQPVLSIAYDPSTVRTIYNYDPEKAKALLEEAGWFDEDGDGIREKDGQKLSFEVLYSEGVETYAIQIPYQQDSWKAIGAEAVTSAVPFQTLLDVTDAGDYDVAVQGFGWGSDGGQDAMFASWNTPPNGFNNARYSNADYDALVEPSKIELVVEERIKILQEQSNIVNDDAGFGFNVFRQNILGAGPNVHNFYPVGYSSFWWLTRAWVDAE